MLVGVVTNNGCDWIKVRDEFLVSFPDPPLMGARARGRGELLLIQSSVSQLQLRGSVVLLGGE